MLLGRKEQNPGARQRIVISYRDWLAVGEQLTAVVCSVSAAPATVDTITLAPDKKSVSFFVDDGTLDTEFNVVVEATTNTTQVRYDRIDFVVRAP